MWEKEKMGPLNEWIYWIEYIVGIGKRWSVFINEIVRSNFRGGVGNKLGGWVGRYVGGWEIVAGWLA